jgi:hypothetical protein
MFSNREVKAFANELAESLVRDLPPKLVLNSANVISANRVTTILERSYSKAAAFQAKHGIGFLGRAAFANEFRWKMADLGYPKEFINVATQGLLVHLSKSKSAGKA